MAIFYIIQINPSKEQKTTFQIRYNLFKQNITSFSLTRYFDKEKEIILEIDTLGQVIGVVLS